jgi:hypothetical protein
MHLFVFHPVVGTDENWGRDSDTNPFRTFCWIHIQIKWHQRAYGR